MRPGKGEPRGGRRLDTMAPRLHRRTRCTQQSRRPHAVGDLRTATGHWVLGVPDHRHGQHPAGPARQVAAQDDAIRGAHHGRGAPHHVNDLMLGPLRRHHHSHRDAGRDRPCRGKIRHGTSRGAPADLLRGQPGTAEVHILHRRIGADDEGPITHRHRRCIVANRTDDIVDRGGDGADAIEFMPGAHRGRDHLPSRRMRTRPPTVPTQR